MEWEKWFKGYQQVGHNRGVFIIKAFDKEHALGRMMLYMADNPVLGFAPDDTSEVFEPHIEEASPEEASYYSRAHAGLASSVILQSMSYPPAEIPAATFYDLPPGRRQGF